MPQNRDVARRSRRFECRKAPLFSESEKLGTRGQSRENGVLLQYGFFKGRVSDSKELSIREKSDDVEVHGVATETHQAFGEVVTTVSTASQDSRW